MTGCIAAAAAEFDVPRQQSFLRAASYGKAFCDPTMLNPSHFVATSQRLRLLNHLRRADAGMPLTLDQLEVLGLGRLLQRLCHRNQHFLALKVCELLETDNQPVLTDWAVAKMRAMVAGGKDDNAAIFQAMVSQMKAAGAHSKLRPGQAAPYFSSIDVASAAFQANKAGLAEIVLDAPNGPSPEEQVPLLLRVGASDLALRKVPSAFHHRIRIVCKPPIMLAVLTIISTPTPVALPPFPRQWRRWTGETLTWCT